MDNEVAGLMLTQPNTLGLFEDNIEKISKMIHDVDGLMYMDGANLNALVGIAKPKLMGFDIMHINLHKTFSTPHGGGGPGSGPVAVHSKLKKYLPTGVIKKKVDNYYIDNNDNNTIGKVHTFYGNFGILVRAYVYILSLGSKGLQNIALYAVLNANYLKYLLSKNYDIPFSEGTLHEFVISAVKQKEKGIRALDIGKSLLDYGYHAPTVYFPTNIRESIMIEPTETEDKKTLEEFADAMINIDQKIDSNLDYLLNSPHKTPVRRLNEVMANRELDINYNEIQKK
jgi:glycine dehydrogenase subunit 2